MAHMAEMVPNRPIKATILDAKTIVVSCGILEMVHSTYGYQASKAVEQLRGKPWSSNMLEKHWSIFEQAWSENFRHTGLESVNTAAGTLFRRKLYLDLTGAIHTSDKELDHYKVKQKLAALTALDVDGYNLVVVVCKSGRHWSPAVAELSQSALRRECIQRTLRKYSVYTYINGISGYRLENQRCFRWIAGIAVSSTTTSHTLRLVHIRTVLVGNHTVHNTMATSRTSTPKRSEDSRSSWMSGDSFPRSRSK